LTISLTFARDDGTDEHTARRAPVLGVDAVDDIGHLLDGSSRGPCLPPSVSRLAAGEASLIACAVDGRS
jgi:hypothetical protein